MLDLTDFVLYKTSEYKGFLVETWHNPSKEILIGRVIHPTTKAVIHETFTSYNKVYKQYDSDKGTLQ